jgi:tetratricopeptide (TPR) repeat protein
MRINFPKFIPLLLISSISLSPICAQWESATFPELATHIQDKLTAGDLSTSGACAHYLLEHFPDECEGLNPELRESLNSLQVFEWIERADLAMLGHWIETLCDGYDSPITGIALHRLSESTLSTTLCQRAHDILLKHTADPHLQALLKPDIIPLDYWSRVIQDTIIHLESSTSLQLNNFPPFAVQLEREQQQFLGQLNSLKQQYFNRSIFALYVIELNLQRFNELICAYDPDSWNRQLIQLKLSYLLKTERLWQLLVLIRYLDEQDQLSGIEPLLLQATLNALIQNDDTLYYAKALLGGRWENPDFLGIRIPLAETLAYKLRHTGDMFGAIDTLSLLLTANPDNAHAGQWQLARGLALMELDQIDRACADFAHILQVSHHAEILSNAARTFASLMVQRSNPSKALMVINEALARLNTSDKGYWELKRLLVRIEPPRNTARAVRTTFEPLIADCPFIEIRGALALDCVERLIAAGYPAQAHEQLKRIQDLTPSQETHQLWLMGRLSMDLEGENTHRKRFESCVEDPETPATRYTLQMLSHLSQAFGEEGKQAAAKALIGSYLFARGNDPEFKDTQHVLQLWLEQSDDNSERDLKSLLGLYRKARKTGQLRLAGRILVPLFYKQPLNTKHHAHLYSLLKALDPLQLDPETLGVLAVCAPSLTVAQPSLNQLKHCGDFPTYSTYRALAEVWHHFQSGHFAQAQEISHTLKMERLSRLSEPIAKLKARCAFNLGACDQAIDLLKQLSESENPDHAASALLELADTMAHLDRASESLPLYFQLILLYPSSEEAVKLAESQLQRQFAQLVHIDDGFDWIRTRGGACEL